MFVTDVDIKKKGSEQLCRKRVLYKQGKKPYSYINVQNDHLKAFTASDPKVVEEVLLHRECFDYFIHYMEEKYFNSSKYSLKKEEELDLLKTAIIFRIYNNLLFYKIECGHMDSQHTGRIGQLFKHLVRKDKIFRKCLSSLRSTRNIILQEDYHHEFFCALSNFETIFVSPLGHSYMTINVIKYLEDNRTTKSYFLNFSKFLE